jgi:hypothetical protein
VNACPRRDRVENLRGRYERGDVLTSLRKREGLLDGEIAATAGNGLRQVRSRPPVEAAAAGSAGPQRPDEDRLHLLWDVGDVDDGDRHGP